MPGKCRLNPVWQDIVYEWVLPDTTRDLVESKHCLCTFVCESVYSPFYLVNYCLPTYCFPSVNQCTEGFLIGVLTVPTSANEWKHWMSHVCSLFSPAPPDLPVPTTRGESNYRSPDLQWQVAETVLAVDFFFTSLDYCRVNRHVPNKVKVTLRMSVQPVNSHRYFSQMSS
jgi:hypothetical protein